MPTCKFEFKIGTYVLWVIFWRTTDCVKCASFVDWGRGVVPLSGENFVPAGQQFSIEKVFILIS